MAKDLPQLVNNIADDHPLKAFLSNQMNGVIQSKNYGKVLELFDLVVEAGTQFDATGEDTNCDASDGDSDILVNSDEENG